MKMKTERQKWKKELTNEWMKEVWRMKYEEWRRLCKNRSHILICWDDYVWWWWWCDGLTLEIRTSILLPQLIEKKKPIFLQRKFYRFLHKKEIKINKNRTGPSRSHISGWYFVPCFTYASCEHPNNATLCAFFVWIFFVRFVCFQFQSFWK